MLKALVRLIDIWIGRRAVPQPAALAVTARLSPAVVITGASRGIGRALALKFAASHRDLLLVARDEDGLAATAREISQTAGARAHVLALDITDADGPQKIDRALAASGLYADVLVNNAGIGISGAFRDAEQARIDAMLALNTAAATRLMRHFLPQMTARAQGGVINIASLGGFVPGPYQAAYYASKAYLLSLTEAVAYEQRGRGVRIMAVAPGPVDTGFHRSMQAESALYRAIVPAISAERVARSAYYGFLLGRRVVVPGILPSLSALAVKLLPHTISVPLVGTLLGVGLRSK